MGAATLGAVVSYGAEVSSSMKGPKSLRVALHDYSGHPFQIQLSRTLATRGHQVLHLHSTTFQTPKGPVTPVSNDPPSFAVEGVNLGEPFHKYSFVRRLSQERRYGRLLVDRLARFEPDVVISANTPLDAQAISQDWAQRHGIGFIFWLQDIYSVAIKRTLRRRLSFLAAPLALRFTRLEGRLLRRADAVVAITDDFLPALASWGVERERITVIENWAPLDEIAPVPKANQWARDHGLADVPVFLYAGTLGLKHDPSILLRLAQGVPEAKVVVVSEGIGADWLRQHGDNLANLEILPYQPFGRLSEVLGSGDILVVILEPEAGAFSVPSKVMTSLAAGRAILAAIPRSNLAARIIERVGAGRVVEPGDRDRFVIVGRSMLADSSGREASSRAARSYAEAAFDIIAIADLFEAIIRRAVGRGARSSQSSAPDPPSAGMEPPFLEESS